MTAAGFILMIAIGVMGAYESAAPSLIATLLIISGVGITAFALIASGIAVVRDLWKATITAKPQELGSPTKQKQSGVGPANKPTVPPGPVSGEIPTKGTPVSPSPSRRPSSFPASSGATSTAGAPLFSEPGLQEDYDMTLADCDYCYASGECQICGGYGSDLCQICSGVGCNYCDYGDGQGECNECLGTGECFHCSGTGSQ